MAKTMPQVIEKEPDKQKELFLPTSWRKRLFEHVICILD